MNTSRLPIRFTMLAASLAGACAMQVANAAGPEVAQSMRIVQLPTVHVTGKRLGAEPTLVVQLPTVVVTGKRITVAQTLLAGKTPRSAPAARAAV